MSAFVELDTVFATARTVFATVRDVLRTPEAFFAERDQPSVSAGGGVVLSAGLALWLVALPFTWILRFVLPTGELREIVAVLVVAMLGYVVVRWLLLAVVVYGVGRLCGGSGGFRDLLAFLGWSFLPNVFASAVLLAAVTAAAAAAGAPATEAELVAFGEGFGEDPLFQLAAAAGFVRAETGVSLSQLQFGLGLVQFAWNASIWFAAAKVGLSLDDRRALVAIAVPVVFTGILVGLQHVNVGVIV